jgi:hypothetical protein
MRRIYPGDPDWPTPEEFEPDDMPPERPDLSKVEFEATPLQARMALWCARFSILLTKVWLYWSVVTAGIGVALFWWWVETTKETVIFGFVIYALWAYGRKVVANIELAFRKRAFFFADGQVPVAKLGAGDSDRRFGPQYTARGYQVDGKEDLFPNKPSKEG